MYIFVLVVHIIVSLILVAVILLQAGRGGGLAETFGGGGGQATIFGQKASTFLTRATTVSAVLFLCTSLGLAFISSKRQKSLMEGVRALPTAPKEQIPTTSHPEAKEEPKTVERTVKVDPVTGKETVVEEKVIPTPTQEQTQPQAEQAPVTQEQVPSDK